MSLNQPDQDEQQALAIARSCRERSVNRVMEIRENGSPAQLQNAIADFRMRYGRDAPEFELFVIEPVSDVHDTVRYEPDPNVTFAPAFEISSQAT